jgi:hypothetical protein
MTDQYQKQLKENEKKEYANVGDGREKSLRV